MNKDTRKRINGHVSTIRDAIARIEEAKSELETIRDDEQAKFDGMNEGLQQSLTGQAIEEKAQEMDTHLSDLDSAISDLESAIESIETPISELENL